MSSRPPTVQNNTVYDNYDGISFSYGSSSEKLLNNRVYHNSHDGIYLGGSNGTTQANLIYSNGMGIEATFGSNLITGNLIYANTTGGMYVHDVSTFGTVMVRVINNTIYQTTGDALRLLTASGVEVRNNILQADTGYGLVVPEDSEFAFVSDFNLFYSAGGGKLGNWQGVDFTNINTWVRQLGQDRHSLVANPQFINPAARMAFLATTPPPRPTKVRTICSTSSRSRRASMRGIHPRSMCAEPARNGSRINLGYDGNTPQAAESATIRCRFFRQMDWTSSHSGSSCQLNGDRMV